MTSRIDRYVARAIGYALLGATVALFGLLFLLDVLARMDSTGGAASALLAALATAPRRLIELAPFAALLGSVLGFGVLAADAELTALRASGVGPAQLLRGASWPLTGLLLLVVVASEWVLPWAALARAKAAPVEDAISQHWRWQDEVLVVTSVRGGEWLAEQRFSWRAGALHVAASEQRQRAARRDRVELWRAQQAAAGRLRVTRSQTDIGFHSEAELADWAYTLPTPREARTLAVHDLLRRLAAAPATASATSSATTSTGVREDARARARITTLLWQRVAAPVGILLLAVLGALIVFALPARGALGIRIASALAVAIVFKYAADLAAPLVILYEWPAPLAAALPLLVLLLGILVLVHSQRASRSAPSGSWTVGRPRSPAPG